MPFLALLGLWGVAELVALIAVVAQIGFFATLGLLILSSAIGSWLLRSQQQAVLRMAETPGRDVARESVYRMTAGVLLLVPGFISSALALIFLVPPLRALFAGAWCASSSRRRCTAPSPGGRRAMFTNTKRRRITTSPPRAKTAPSSTAS